MRTAVLFSGGKDSCLALYYAMKSSEVKCLITLVSENPESYMFHTPNIRLAKKQAEAIPLPIIIQKTKGEKEAELKDLEKAIKKAIKKYKIQGIFSGAIRSVYQASRIQKICNFLGIECSNPIWQNDPREQWDFLLKEGFEIVVVGVFAEGLNQNWLGRKIDRKALEELELLSKKFNFHLGFEGGEAETFVTDCPLFKKRIGSIKARREWMGNSGVYIIEKVKLTKK